MKLEIKGRISEANIQAEFYRRCKDNNLHCYLEYKHEKSRFDAVMYYRETLEIYAIIEVKSYAEKKAPNLDTKQLKKYNQYNIPVYVIGRMEAIDEVIEDLLLKNT
jgi:hypothetical protein